MVSATAVAVAAGVLARRAREVRASEAALATRRPLVAEPATRKAPRRAGLVPVLLLLVCGVGLVVPWTVPGFAGALTDLFSSSAPAATVTDPAVLPTEPSSPTTSRGPTTTPGVPTSIAVPRLQVDSVVVPISGQSGALLPPSDPQMIGWWAEGPQPGSAEGTAVLTGHTVHTGGGAFDHLLSLRAGDHFVVRTDHGPIRYVIVAVHKYATGELARTARSVFRLSGPPRVLLVTCSGWNGHIYLENTVVTGEAA